MIPDCAGRDRRPDWEPRFVSFLRDLTSKSYQPGSHDCVVASVAGTINAITGMDPARGHRGKYRSGPGALRHLRSLGVETIADLLDAMLSPVPVAKAWRGDIVAIDDSPGVALGNGKAWFMLHEGEGPFILPLRTWTRAWAVGRR